MTTSLDEAPEPAASAPVRRARRPWGRLFLALALLIIAALFAAWLQRRTIAREFVDRELNRRGVRAQYQIERLSPWHQRLTQVVIGDPRDPDLVADWIEIGTSLSPWRAEMLELRAGHVRAKARLIDGRLSLGAIDRLMPPSSGKPFALPHVRLDVADARLRLDSGHGMVDFAVKGRGMLDDGFSGAMQLAAPRLDLAGCAGTGLTGALDLRIRQARPMIGGTLAGSALRCADLQVTAPKTKLQATLGPALDRWTGTADVALARIEMAGRRVSAVEGRISFDGSVADTQGKIALRSGRFEAPEAIGAALHLAGDYRQRPAGFGYRGTLVARSAGLSRPLREQIGAAAAGVQDTPLGPVAARLARSAATAAGAFDATADFGLAASAAGMTYHIPRVALVAASGARLTFDRGTGVTGAGSAAAPRIEGTLAVRGGGMPEAMVRLSQRPGDTRLHGTGFVQPYAADGASLSLSRIAFVLGAEGGTLQTMAMLSGPLAGGRIDGLALPLDARWRGRRVTVNPACIALRYRRIALAGVILAPGRAQACPLGGAMVEVSPGAMSGGIRLVRPELAGQVGASPLLLRGSEARLDLGKQRFSLAGAQVRLGAERVTRLDMESLGGSFARRIAGDFAGLSGQIGGVPLVISGAAGNWAVEGGGLVLAGKLQVRDAEASPRFHPLASDDARLRLVDGTIIATAGLNAPTGMPVAQVEIRHDLGEGKGAAKIAVPGLRFAEGGLQPSDLTPLTFGLIADVSGTVEGSGEILWSPDGVSSSGRFGTRAIDLAAAFGPVRGLATELIFSDLLNMRTAPGQVATTVEINPGVPVRNGTIRFRLLDSQRIEVEGARWPFAGGELVLEPTILDFSERQARRMTFQVIGADAALFLKEMEFDNLDATGTFDGTLPMIFDAQGGRIEGGSLRARAGGSLAYVGEISQRDVGFWGNMAFQALKALDYRNLTIDMNGPLDGDMVTEIRFSGVSQGKGTKSNFLLRRLAKLPFVFNVRVSAPFKQLLDSVQSWYDPNRLIERNLPSLLEEQERSGGEGGTKPVQPRESDKLR
ncbi:YdbH domain-containing protein [Sphingomonas sp. DG1-23]|uniref:YdbH domain-containing protein n=1 Tax=Sphingomonas sp. DG1-23 TaxID=3068316 RepID=UPI00273DDEE1|nr:YdbH domain-containing protein [Sphingomonas sp. DG1-23]MDP5281382.1 YdbH domain-containing protein [Sphingomonas sp. DG1-23]